jgi:aspartyl-tRNA(Asn)/glutamyl-tRNA(Gln) amidotransferase subunit A
MKKILYELTVKEAAGLLKSGEISSLELVTSCLQRIKEMEPTINAFITVTEESALVKAKEVDTKRKRGEKLSVLAGIPFSLKDVYATKGIKTTAGSKMLADYYPQYDATVYKRLLAADAILIGKTNCDPFGFGSSTEYSAYGITKNPIDTSRVPGGSSGGSAAAVAYGGGLFSIGEDTGGSIRCPASFCGIVGLKPTYGRVSRYGSIPYASSYDTVGPMTKTVEDNAIVLSVIAGEDEHDATSSRVEPAMYQEAMDIPVKSKTIGLPKEYFTNDLDKEVKEIVMAAVEKYKTLGCKIKEVSLPYTEYAIAAYYIVGISEASSNLARFDGIRYGFDRKGKKYDIEDVRGEGFGPEEKRRIMIGTYALSAGYADQYYKKAQAVRALLKKDFARVLEEVDVVLTPTMPILPFKIGENLDDPLKMWLVDAFTVSLNPTGLPGLSVPAGKSKSGLPIGMQLIGPHLKEEVLYNFAYKFEKENETKK